IGESDGTHYIAMEFVDGKTLREKIHGEKGDLKALLKHLLQVAEGLAKAHAAGIVHRDLKPDNIMVTQDGHAKILDFGLAKLLETKPASEVGEAATAMMPVQHSTPGVVLGTAGYMSPEQAKGKRVDQRSDIFSFGAILYEMLSGNRAFRGDSIAETMSAILREDPPDLSETNKTVSPALERVVRHCLEKNPAERFHSARDLAFAIEALSAPTSASGNDLTAAANVVVAKTRTSVWRVRIPWIAAGVFALLAATGFWLWRLNRSSTGDHAMWLAFSPPPNVA